MKKNKKILFYFSYTLFLFFILFAQFTQFSFLLSIITTVSKLHFDPQFPILHFNKTLRLQYCSFVYLLL